MEPISSLSIIAVCCSLHLQQTQGFHLEVNPAHYQQFNPGIGVEYELEGFGAALAIFYRNSYGKGATVAAWSPYRGWARPFVGLADGYLIDGLGKIAPVAGLNLEPWHHEGPTFTVTPMNLHGIVLGGGWKEPVTGWIR